jgi:hypothetical protein
MDWSLLLFSGYPDLLGKEPERHGKAYEITLLLHEGFILFTITSFGRLRFAVRKNLVPALFAGYIHPGCFSKELGARTRPQFRTFINISEEALLEGNIDCS